MRQSITTIVLVDDHIFMRDLMARMLARLTQRYRVVDAVGTAAEALLAAKRFAPDLLVLDVYLPDKRGPEVLPEIKRAAPHTRVLLCSAFPVDDPVLEFARSGADGFVEKTNTWSDFLVAVERVSRGERYFWSRARSSSAQLGDDPAIASEPKLTSREIQILKLIASGLTSKEIAAQLHISAATVDTHRNNVMAKLQVRNVAELVSAAYERRLVEVRARQIRPSKPKH